MVKKMSMKKFCVFAVFIIMFGCGVQSASAASQDVPLDNLTDTTKDALNNASDMANQTAEEVNSFLDPIQSILNSINSVLQQIQQIMSFFGGGQ